MSIVFKLGGSSVSSIGALSHFAERLRGETRPALVVVSALSKVTDSLERLAVLSWEDHTEAALDLIENLRARHLTFISQTLPAMIAPYTAEKVGDILSVLTAVGNGTLARPECFRQHRDFVLHFGEAAGSVIVTAFLRHHLGRAEHFDARNVLVTDGTHGHAEPLEGPSRLKLEANLRPLLTPGSVVVTQGFCGATETGLTTTLGRGGSDFSATWLGALLGAEEIEIRTDTPGVLSADPRLVTTAATLRRISHQRASTLAHFGAKVLHPRCIEPVLGTTIPVRVLSSFNPEEPGTTICESDDPDAFSVTATAGYFGVGVRPPALSPTLFRSTIEALANTPQFLALAVDDEEARVCFTQEPKGTVDILFQASHLVYVMTSLLERGLLDSLCEELRRAGMVVHGAFMDPHRGGLVFALDEEDERHARIVLHRAMKRALKPVAAPW